jgi:hypothetical protein
MKGLQLFPTTGTKIQKEEEFFDKNFMMSYSGLNKLLYSPRLFYLHYIMGQRDDSSDKFAIEGKLIHCLFLNPDDFDKEFVLSVNDIPSDNPKEVLQRLYNHYKELNTAGDPRVHLEHFEHAILDILKDMNLYQSLKTDAQRIEKIIIEKHVSYWEYLKNAEGKQIVDPTVYEQCVAVVEEIKANDVVMKVMGYRPDYGQDLKIQNEVELAAIDEKYPMFGLRGFVDNLVIDYTNKTIFVNDLKKSSKDIGSFVDSIEYYRYWMQASMYYMLVDNVYLSKPEYKDYKFEFRFIVIDNYLQIAPIRVSDKTLKEWVVKTETLLNQADYHFVNRSFDLPYQFLINNELVL